MLAGIIIVSVIFQGVLSNRRFPYLNQGTELQKSDQTPWRNIWTTLSPPTSPKPKRLSVYDTIRATAAASERVNGNDPFHESIVSPTFYKAEAVLPTRGTVRYPSAAVNVRGASIQQASGSIVKQYPHVKVSPTAETRFTGIKRPMGNLIRQDTNRVSEMSGISARGNTGSLLRQDTSRVSPLSGISVRGNTGSLLRQDTSRVSPLSGISVRGNTGSLLRQDTSRVSPLSGIGARGNTGSLLRQDTSRVSPMSGISVRGNTESLLRQDTSRVSPMSGISAGGNTGRPGKSSAMARRTHLVRDTGLNEEAGMFDTQSISQGPSTSGHFDLFAGRPDNAIALYAVDHGHGHGTSTARDQYAQTSTILENNSPKESRFKILPDGSIVDYGISGGAQRTRKQRLRTTSPLARTAEASVQNSGVSGSKQVQPTYTSRVLSSTGYSSTSTINREHTSANILATAHKQVLLPAGPPVQPTRDSIQPVGYNSPSGLDAHGGLPVDDSLSYVIDDPRRQKDDRSFLNSSPVRNKGVHDYLGTHFNHLSLEPTFTPRNKTSTTYEPTSTTRRKTTTKTPPTTTTASTTTTETTTTTTTTTTTPKPKPKDDYWTKQGGVPINITYLNDNHVCPKSRARWQDYTVYLETKPRLCMIQITFNARYKREPIYHNSWWGQNVEWIYRTVYDPEIKVVDLHGWRGSTWYG